MMLMDSGTLRRINPSCHVQYLLLFTHILENLLPVHFVNNVEGICRVNNLVQLEIDLLPLAFHVVYDLNRNMITTSKRKWRITISSLPPWETFIKMMATCICSSTVSCRRKDIQAEGIKWRNLKDRESKAKLRRNRYMEKVRKQAIE